jgi:GNAT superfamily N-acetyltransferase
MPTWREVQSESDPVLADWLAMYERSFPNEVRLPREVVTAQIAEAGRTPRGEDVLHVAAAMEGDAVVGGANFTYLGRSNVGLLSYIFTAPERRGRGVGGWIYRQVTTVLRADAARRGRSLEGVLLEVERDDLATGPEREERVRRLRFFAGAGARVVTGVDYLQPPLHPGEEPLPMHLMFDPAGAGRPAPSCGEVLAWVDDIYRVIYGDGAGLDEHVLQECSRRVRRAAGLPS